MPQQPTANALPAPAPVLAPALKERVAQEIKRVLPEVIAFRHERHRHPELTWQETQTAKAVADRLRRIPGLTVEEGVGRLGVVAILEGQAPGPTVALRADMDALPVREVTGKAYASCVDGVMHACGHDGHMANLYGAALVLASLRDQLRGKVKLIFQPAEEGGAGAEVMCQAGVLEQPKVDVIFGLHGWSELPCGHVYTSTGALLAATANFAIRVEGTGCHAALPHLGTDQILVMARIIDGLQAIRSRVVNPSEPMALSVTKVQAGTTHNVIPAHADCLGTLRTISEVTRDRAVAAINRLAESIAAAHGARATVTWEHGYPATINHPEATAFLEQVAGQVLAPGQVQRIPAPSLGGEDFAFFLQRVPGAYFFLGMDDGRPGGYPSLHHPGYDFNDQALPVGMSLFVHATLAYSQRPPIAALK